MIRDPLHDAARQILQIIPLVMRVFAADLRHSEHCLVPAHFRVLGMLSHRAWTLSELAEIQAVSLPTMSSTITTLEERGWVTRTRPPDDRRVVRVELTAEGQRVIEQTHQHAEERLAQLLAPLPQEDREQLLKGLEILRTVFQGSITPEEEGVPSTYRLAKPKE